MGNSVNCFANCKTTPEVSELERTVLFYRFYGLTQRLKQCRAQKVHSQSAESELRELLGKFDWFIKNWRGAPPEVGKYFDQPGEIDWLLAEVVQKLEPRRARRIVNYATHCGYRDEPPKLDGNGEPLLQRTTAVHLAARCMDCRVIVPSLFGIYNRFDANYVDDTGLTHFHAACIAGCAGQMVRFIRFAKVDPNLAWRETGERPLHLICARRPANDDDGHTLKMFFWINEVTKRTINVDARDKLGNTPLLVALKHDNLEAVELLLRKGADPNLANDAGSTALLVVCAKNDDVSMRSFLEVCDELGKRVDVDVQDNEGNASLHLALRNNQWEAAELLLRRGADPNLTDARGFTALHHICQRHPLRDDVDTVKLFFDLNEELGQLVRVDARDNDGRTPLQWAVASLLPNAVDVLLDRGADLSSFTLPTDSHFYEIFRRYRMNNPLDFNFVQASGLLACVECLEQRGYELHQDEALLVMKIFVNYGWYENCSIYRSVIFDRPFDRDSLGALLADQRFATEAKRIKIRAADASSPSLLDLIQLSDERAAKLLAFKEYFELARRWYGSRAGPVRDCTGVLCARVSMDLFRDWSLGFFMTLMNYRLPLENCMDIIKQLELIDLYFICLAATGRGDVKSISIYA